MRASRRTVLAAGAGALSLSFPLAAFGQNNATDKRFIFIILRGGMDGLAAVPAIGDAAYASARGRLAADDALRLDSTFALHPNLPKLHGMYAAGEALIVHACATAYRDRSHFDAQNVLESGAAAPFARDAGWLNAALGALPGALRGSRRELGLALASQAPLAMRGETAVATWSPSPLPETNADTLARLMALYRERDAQLAQALDDAIAANALAGDDAMNGARGPRAIDALARVAANFLARDDGPIAAMIELNGWDTHAQQGLAQGALARNLRTLDAGLDALKTAMGERWRHTIVVAATEFGRTVAPNGAGGTDHGTAGAAILVGGAVQGGRVLADWPGLAPSALYEGRDLRPTTDLRAVLKGVLADHLQAPNAALERTVFPDSAAARATPGLVGA